MEKLNVMADFGGVGVIPVIKFNSYSYPSIFSISLFFIWIFGTASAYFAMLNFTGRKRFFHALVGMSFATFIMSLVLAGMNATITYLSGYWVAFYLVMTVISFVLLDRYK
jgi:hypothetical protein